MVPRTVFGSVSRQARTSAFELNPIKCQRQSAKRAFTNGASIKSTTYSLTLQERARRVPRTAFGRRKTPWLAGQRRPISSSTCKRYANVEDAEVDIASMERESDSVDVLIVGGGKHYIQKDIEIV